MANETTIEAGERQVRIPADGVPLDGDLTVPAGARGVILFAHGSGSSRHSSRNRYVAKTLQEAGFATLLMDLLTRAEEAAERSTGHLRFDIPLLARRLVSAGEWLRREPATRRLPVGCFGASTGGGAALAAAGVRPDLIRVVVSRGGRPDLAGDFLPQVQAPTLLLVGSNDVPVIGMNENAMARMRTGNAEVRLEIIPGATHLFEEPGTLEEVARHATMWFTTHLDPPAGSGTGVPP